MVTDQRVTDVRAACAKVALYLAARSSRTLWTMFLEARDPVKILAEPLRRYGFTPTIIRKVHEQIQREGSYHPLVVGNPDRLEIDPCPDPPCGDYIGDMTKLIAVYTVVQPQPE